MKKVAKWAGLGVVSLLGLSLLAPKPSEPVTEAVAHSPEPTATISAASLSTEAPPSPLATPVPSPTLTPTSTPTPTPEPVQPPPTPTPTPPPTPACDPNYTPCIPNVAYDLDCKDIGFMVHVIGTDRHKLDRDKDGYGCE
jgi:outer membrane biosynthesis protein TonB